jgi:phosphoribosylformylglycinamidine synthase
VHAAISLGLVRSCHDLSEGGLAASLAEMAVAGGLGARVSLRDVPCDDDAASDGVLLFSESPSRFLLEVRPDAYEALADVFGPLPLGRLGDVSEAADAPRLGVTGLDGTPVVDAPISALKDAWQRPLKW